MSLHLCTFLTEFFLLFAPRAVKLAEVALVGCHSFMDSFCFLCQEQALPSNRRYLQSPCLGIGVGKLLVSTMCIIGIINIYYSSCLVQNPKVNK